MAWSGVPSTTGLVRLEDLRLHYAVHSPARFPSAPTLRPTHGLRLEGTAPGYPVKPAYHCSDKIDLTHTLGEEGQHQHITYAQHPPHPLANLPPHVSQT